uniref:RRP15-like protein n=1 Tax=Araucaria cunninghamii TaxID=56994 RepID=A0A0D6R259_ARACU
MTAQVAVSTAQKRNAEYEAAQKHKKKTKTAVLAEAPNPKPKTIFDSSEEEEEEQENRHESSEEGEDEDDIAGSSEGEGYSFGEEEEDEASGSSDEEKERQEENGASANKDGEDDEEGEEEEEGYAGSSEEEGDKENGSGSDGGEKPGIRFADGSNAFRAAFTKIMEKKVPDDGLGPVLSAHKKLIAKKLDEEAIKLKVRSEAKKEKRLMREKGHVKLESFLDAKEKSLVRLATKGVVKLFNAVSKAQSVKNSFDVSNSKGAKAATKESKAAFLSELRGVSRSVKPAQFGPIKTQSSTIGEVKNEVKEPGWAALRDDFMLTSSKFKDWDKTPDAAAEDVLQEMPVDDSDNSSDVD